MKFTLNYVCVEEIWRISEFGVQKKNGNQLLSNNLNLVIIKFNIYVEICIKLIKMFIINV